MVGRGITMDLLWKDYFKDPSLWRYSYSKKNSTLPDIKHINNHEALWIDLCYNPCWVYEELRRRPNVFSSYEGVMMEKPCKKINNMNKEEDFAFIALLKACAKKKDLDKGSKLHTDIQGRGLLEKSPFLASSLISMYAKCGFFSKAQEVLEQLTVRNVVSWSALIAGYVQHRQGHKALNCFAQMESEGLSPDSVTFASILKACGSIGSIEKGKEIHDKIVSNGLLKKDVILGNALVDMYVKCGVLVKARQVLEELPIRDVVSWSTLISGYADEGQFHEAIDCLEWMQDDGLSPNVVTLTSILKACGSIEAMEKGKEIHCEVVRRGLLEKDMVLGNALVDMYAKCGFLAKAKQVLNELPVRGVVSWSALLAGYAQWGQCDEALNSFKQMQREGLFPNGITFVSILKACGMTGAIEEGIHIHQEILNRGLLEKDSMLGNVLVDMYAKCGMLAKAQEVLEELPIQNVAAWNALITGYAQQRQCNKALSCYEQMQREGLSPDVVTYICIVNACGSIGAIDKGEQIHKDIVNRGFQENDIVLGTALVDMYAKCGVLAKAEKVFNKLPSRNVVTWSALITGYTQQGQGYMALNCFEQMRREGLSPDVVTFICLLKSCGSIGTIDEGKIIHDEILNQGLLQKDIVLGNALVDMYIKCGALAKAHEVMEELPVRDVVSWSALIAGHTQHGQCDEAINCFERMQGEGLSPNSITFICVLKACGNTGYVEKGEQIHEEILKRGLLKHDCVLGTALVDMYAKCGVLSKSQEVLEELPIRDIISWNTLITGYAQQGQVQQALNNFEHMQSEGLSPDHITFLSLLSACNHLGLLDEAQMLFKNMSGKYRITLNFEHQTCMVMVLGCAGNFESAMSLIKVMPCDYTSGWLALLAACRKWGHVKLGRVAFEQVVQLDSHCAAAYALMASIFVAAGMKEEAQKVKSIEAEICCLSLV